MHYNENQVSVRDLQHLLTKDYPDQSFPIIQADLSKKAGVDALVKGIDQPITCLVHNAGMSHIGLVQDVPRAVLHDFLHAQLAAPFILTQKLLPDMVRARKGKIIFVTSIWGETGASTEALYSMIKGGQNSLVKALAKELAPSGISVNGVAPGAIDTAMMADFDMDTIRSMKEDIPAGRLGSPREVAGLVRFLTSPHADYINGQIISINGAWYC